MKVSRANIVISDITEDERLKLEEILNFVEVPFNIFEVDGEKRIEVFRQW